MTSLSIFKSMKSFLPVVCIGLGLLLLVTRASMAQGLFGNSLGAPQSYLSLGNLGAGCGDSGLVPSLGLFSAGYNYNSFNFGGGIRYNELMLSYYLPWQISRSGCKTSRGL